MVVLVAVYGAGGALFVPSFTGIVRDVVPRDLLLEANALDQFVRPLCARLIGPAVGGVLIGVVGRRKRVPRRRRAPSPSRRRLS